MTCDWVSWNTFYVIFKFAYFSCFSTYNRILYLKKILTFRMAEMNSLLQDLQSNFLNSENIYSPGGWHAFSIMVFL